MSSINGPNLYRKKSRIFPDGTYFINSKISKSRSLCIIKQKRNDGATLINGNKTLNAHQCFIIKFHKKIGFYTIMALHSHKYLGVNKNETNFCFSFICQYPLTDDYLLYWDINLVNESFYTLELVGTDLFLGYYPSLPALQLNQKSYEENMLFTIKTIPVIKNGFYQIYGKYDSKLGMIFPSKSTDSHAIASHLMDEMNSTFYIYFDEQDGCYSLTTLQNLILSAKNDSDHFIYQIPFTNLDNQKFIISSFDIDRGDFFFELKSNLLRLEITDDNTQIKLCSYKPNFQGSKNQLFHIKPLKIDENKQKNLNQIIESNKKRQSIIYADSLKIKDSTEEIKDDLFCNCYLLKELMIPNSIKKISKKAFENCYNIKIISCDPKWLKYLPNPLNVSSLIVNDGVTEINDDLSDFRNLVGIYLPSSLKRITQNAFENIYTIKLFVGNLKFINLINTISLEKVTIASYVKCIPKEAFSGCKNLKEVTFDKNPKLEVIGSLAFANCESLEPFKMPKSVNNIAPDAFVGCPKESIPKINNESQRLSMLDNLIINSYVTRITKDYSACFNIESLEIPLTVDEIENGVFTNFKRLKHIKCHPKWLNCFPNSKIETVFIPDEIDIIYKKDFENLNYLKFVEIPDNVVTIEDNAFDSCKDLTSFKCGTKHLPFLNPKKIKTLILSNEVKSVDRSHFKKLVNLESLALHDKIKISDRSTFYYCKKLTQINNPYYENFLNNKAYIKEGTINIRKRDFQDWTNLTLISIPKSVVSIESGTFNNIPNIKTLICDPKFFKYFTKNCIKEITIPDFVKELSKGPFDNLFFLTKLTLPDNIKIKDPCIFDKCNNLQNLHASPSIINSLSAKIRNRFVKKVVKREYVKPVFNFPPQNIEYINDGNDPKKTEIKIKNDYDSDDSENEEEEEMIEKMKSSFYKSFNNSYKKPKETTLNDLIAFDPNNQKYKKYIINIQTSIVQNSIQKTYKPQNSSLEEISKVCSAVCSEINRHFKIVPRTVQLLVILRLADNILNDSKSHGAISEIKTGEGKSLIVTILSIILVQFNRKVDVISSNMELVKRDQSEQEKYFKCFGIKTGVLYDKSSDIEFFNGSTKMLFESSTKSIESEKDNKSIDFNIKVLNCSVVYSTSFNFESLYLDSIYDISPFKRKYDVVLVDEVDNMFIDESRSPLYHARVIDYAFSHDILQIVFLLQSLEASEIMKFLHYYFPQLDTLEEYNIQILKDAAIRACKLTKKVDYIVENDEVVIIDSNTGFKRLGSRWTNYVHEMIEIKEGLKVQQTDVNICQMNNRSYINFYKKIVGVTGTIGSSTDEELLKKGYHVTIFRVPRHFESQTKVFIKKRPSTITQVFKSVCNEVITERNKGRPVLVIWDSIFNAEKFIELTPFLISQQILGIKPESDRKSIQNAGIAETVTIATSAAGRGVDIKLSPKALKAGGLHVIIPMPVSNQRALEQAAGRSGRQGQPGSVTIYSSDDDSFIKPLEWNKGEEHLIKIELKFADYLRKNFPWILSAPKKYGFPNKLFPFNASPSIVLNILGRQIAFIMKGNQITKENEIVQDLSFSMVFTAWGVFYSGLCLSVDECSDWNFIEDLYDHFIKELSVWFPPSKCTTSLKALWHIRGYLIKELDWECIIISGIKIAAVGLSIVFPSAAPIIFIVTNVALSGGQEIYHQLQRGEKVNWLQVLIRSGGSFVRNLIIVTFGINNKVLNMLIYQGETKLYNMAANKELIIDEDEFYDDFEDQLNQTIKLSKNIKGTSESTNKWLYSNIRHKNKKPKDLIKFKPKNYSAILDIDFIRLAMRLAKDSYEGKFKFGKTLLASEKNEIYKPKFYCLEDSNNLFVVTRGSHSLVDWKTDFACKEICQKINGDKIYFHFGFHKAANYILTQIDGFLKKDYKTIYFIGHSYAAAVSSVLTLLTKSDEKFKKRNIYGIAFAPPPAMSYVPSNISDCIYAFINRCDLVTSFSLFNVVNMAAKNRISTKLIFRKILRQIKNQNQKIEWSKNLIQAIEDNFDELTSVVGILNVRKVKGKIFRIGIGNKKCLKDCKINESQLPSNLWIELTSISDHAIDDYIRSFKIIQF